MSIVNRNSRKIKSYTNTIEETSLQNVKKNLSTIKGYLSNFEFDTQDPNLGGLVKDVVGNIEECFRSIEQLRIVNSRLGKESELLIDVAEDSGYIRINTEPVETALKGAMLNVDDFYNFASNYIDRLCIEISNKLINGALPEFREKVTAKLNVLLLQREKMYEAAEKSESQEASPAIAQLEVQIDRLKRCLDASEVYEKRLKQICLEIKTIKNDAYDIVGDIRCKNSFALGKIDLIKKAVNN